MVLYLIFLSIYFIFYILLFIFHFSLYFLRCLNLLFNNLVCVCVQPQGLQGLCSYYFPPSFLFSPANFKFGSTNLALFYNKKIQIASGFCNLYKNIIFYFKLSISSGLRPVTLLIISRTIFSFNIFFAISIFCFILPLVSPSILPLVSPTANPSM